MRCDLPPIPPPRASRPHAGARPVARGATGNPSNRFETLACAPEACAPAEAAEGSGPLRTTFHRDPTRRVLSRNESPDVGFDTGLNPYRGCEHGCIYCYARPTHEYLGFSAGLDFESRILVKETAPELLRLPQGVAGLFEAWLEQHHPERKRRILSRIRNMRGGRLDDPRFHSRMRGSGAFAEQIHALFDLSRRRAGLLGAPATLSADAFRVPPGSQLTLF